MIILVLQDALRDVLPLNARLGAENARKVRNRLDSRRPGSFLQVLASGADLAHQVSRVIAVFFSQPIIPVIVGVSCSVLNRIRAWSGQVTNAGAIPSLVVAFQMSTKLLRILVLGRASHIVDPVNEIAGVGIE